MPVKLSQVKSAGVLGLEAAESREGTFCTGARISISGKKHKYRYPKTGIREIPVPYGKISVRA